jgi:tyrosine-protein phosphatase YwqE
LLHFFKTHDPDLSKIKIDMHNHIMPNIDDGSSNINESIIISSQLSQWGISETIYTPHIFSELFTTNSASISYAFERLMNNKIHFNMYQRHRFAAEYMLNDSFKSLLSSGEPLLCLKDNMVLVEFPLHFKNLDKDALLVDLFIAGYQPVIAHPERYVYLHRSIENYQRLKDMGCYLQLNLFSMGVYYGPEIKVQAEKLLEAGLIDFISTDMHNTKQLAPLQKILTSKHWRKWENYSFKNSMFIE